jgi:hypothetical protein
MLQTRAAANAEAGYFEQAVNWQKRALEHIDEDKAARRNALKRFKLYETGKPCREEGASGCLERGADRERAKPPIGDGFPRPGLR